MKPAAPELRPINSFDARGIGVVRYPRLVAKDEDCAKKLQKRTLTNLYNERPTWLDLAHQKLDAAVQGVTHVNTPNTPKSAGLVVNKD